jgi:hypothetical protein
MNEENQKFLRDYYETALSYKTKQSILRYKKLIEKDLETTTEEDFLTIEGRIYSLRQCYEIMLEILKERIRKGKT